MALIDLYFQYFAFADGQNVFINPVSYFYIIPTLNGIIYSPIILFLMYKIFL